MHAMGATIAGKGRGFNDQNRRPERSHELPARDNVMQFRIFI
jgi:hypothetical protein